jgi:hypothetical protein
LLLWLLDRLLSETQHQAECRNRNDAGDANGQEAGIKLPACEPAKPKSKNDADAAENSSDAGHAIFLLSKALTKAATATPFEKATITART